MVDLVIRAGTVVDGTGAAPRTADVAIDGGRVVEVGRVDVRGAREIDADGAVVAPGFVDVHTHYDGQATWESRMQPSCWHGVTTVVMGNCGVGFAPVYPDHHDRLIELMEGVEDIPGVALHEGLSWEWQSFPEYLDAVQNRPHDLDIAAQVPHAALRVHAMGERAAAHEAATPDEIATMARLAREAVEAGALGFTTSRSLNHRSIDGELTPSYGTEADELVAIARGMGRGVLQLLTDFTDVPGDFALMRRMVAESGRPLSMTVADAGRIPGLYKEILTRVTEANADGLPMLGQVAARAVGMVLGIGHTLHPFVGNPVWRQVADLDPAAQAERMRDPEFRAAVLAAQTPEKRRNLIGGKLIHRYDLMFEFGEPPAYEPGPDAMLAVRAAAAGVEPAEIAYDVLAGGGMLYVPLANLIDGRLDSLHDMLSHPFTIPGLSDGGAHVGTICDGSYPTSLLTHWTRDRDGARLDLQFVVQRQCRDTARAVGLLDRGVLAPGYRADVNVIDLPRLTLHAPELRCDLPAGGRRLVQRAEGYRHTIVAGEETYRDGEPTDALPGRLVRGAQAAPDSTG